LENKKWKKANEWQPSEIQKGGGWKIENGKEQKNGN
jgi:hypothetical protein